MQMSWLIKMHAPRHPSPPALSSFRNTSHHLPSCPRTPLPSRWNSRQRPAKPSNRLSCHADVLQRRKLTMPAATGASCPTSESMHKQLTTFCWAKGLFSSPLLHHDTLLHRPSSLSATPRITSPLPSSSCSRIPLPSRWNSRQGRHRLTHGVPRARCRYLPIRSEGSAQIRHG